MLHSTRRRMFLTLLLLVVAAVGNGQPTAIAFLPSTQPASDLGQSPAFDCAGVTEIPPSECAALVALYTGTDGPHWSTNTGWLQTTTPCSWYGVTCSAGHVSQLNLDSNNLSGFLPPELGSLTALERLRMFINPISGTLPPALGGLTNLEFLGLGSNLLSGSIPPELGNLAKLRTLALTDTQLSGKIPPELGNLAALESLALAHSQLAGRIPPELGNLITLTGISLTDNQLSGPIPPELGNLTNLRDLDLSYNQLSGPIPPELGNLTNIGLDWFSNPGAGGEASLSPGASRLHDRLTGTALRESNQMAQPAGLLPPEPNTGYLDLSGNRLSGAIPTELGNLTLASGLKLGCNQLTGPLPPAVCCVIRWGSVDYNLLTGYDPASACRPGWYWYLTQTVPPTDLRAVSDEGFVTLTWTPIPYTEHGGFYEISYATALKGPYTVYGWTADKTISSHTIDRLRYDTDYYFRLRTFSAAHANFPGMESCAQASALVSEYSAVASTGDVPPTPTATSTPTATPMPSETPTVTPTPTGTSVAAPIRLWLPLIWR